MSAAPAMHRRTGKVAWSCGGQRRRFRSPDLGTTPTSAAFLPVLVVAAPPESLLVATLRRAVEPLVHAPEPIQSACVAGVGVEDVPVLEHERAHTRPLADVRGHVGPGHL